MVKATEVVYKYYEVEFALKRGNNDALAWFGLFLAGINKFYLIWEECRCREILLSIEIQYGKEGLPQI